MKEKKTNQNIFCKTNPRGGISLIVLVITIIIMIMLAAAIILSISGSNVIEKANQATQKSDFANAKDVATTAYAECMLQGKTGNAEIAYIQTKLDATFGAGKYVAGEKGQVAPIPNGFTVSTISGETKIERGLVIYEGTTPVTDADNNNNEIIDVQEQRNQYVWIPIEGSFERKEWTINGQTQNLDGYMEPLANEVTEYNAMKDSVLTYGGFYIARYEAGVPSDGNVNAIDGNQKPVSVKGARVWDNVPWDSDYAYDGTCGNLENNGCAKISRTLTTSTVESHLVYGVEWDAALKFISKTHSVYPTNSAGKGYYYGEDIIVTTGSDISYAVNNIYDMAGNAIECTMEAFSEGKRVARGGRIFNGAPAPAATRNGYFPDLMDELAFRLPRSTLHQIN